MSRSALVCDCSMLFSCFVASHVWAAHHHSLAFEYHVLMEAAECALPSAALAVCIASAWDVADEVGCQSVGGVVLHPPSAIWTALVVGEPILEAVRAKQVSTRLTADRILEHSKVDGANEVGVGLIERGGGCRDHGAVSRVCGVSCLVIFSYSTGIYFYHSSDSNIVIRLGKWSNKSCYFQINI